MKHVHRFLFGTAVAAVLTAALTMVVVGRQGALANGGIIYVDADAIGENDGTSWDDAHTDLQSALEDAADGDEIWVSEGTYTPTWQFDAADPRSATFQMKNGVAIYGGFDPSVGDIAWEDRDWGLHETILSGDLNSDDGPDFANNAENSYHVFYHPDGTALDATAILDGFTITGGNAESSVPHNQGAGMYNNNGSSPTLTNCTFAGNSASFHGGGMFNIGGSSPSLTNCTFHDNSAGYEGGAMFSSGSAPSLTGCTFQENSAASEGGGMYNGYFSSPSLVNCVFVGNSSGSGGGMFNAWSSWPSLTNCTFTGNSAVYNGGGIYNLNGSSPTMINCILWGDSPQEIFNYDETCSPFVAYSAIQGGCESNPYNVCGMGNINADPLFLDTGLGDLRLQDTSPAIDAGDNHAPGLVGVTTDRIGNTRFVDVLAVVDTGNGDPPIVDMGAYEAFPGVIFVDEDAIGANDGSSWNNAYTTLQHALDAAVDGDHIWVAEGVYTPIWKYDVADPRSATFQLKNGVAIYGGFDPSVGDVAWEDRDWEVNPTILSGDLNGDDGPDFANNGENSYHVFYHPDGSDLDSSAILDGFAISGGNANGTYAHIDGGGMHNHGSSPTLINCTFSGNSAYTGAGMYNYHHSSPTLTDCAFADNESAWDGGGMSNYYYSSPTLSNCTFSGNSASGSGGGMFNLNDSIPLLISVTFSGNSAGSMGGGMYNDETSSPTLINCTFSGNSADKNGGGMYNSSMSSPTMTDSTFMSNSAGSMGGGMYNSHSYGMLTNCTFSGNSAGDWGGGMFNADCSPKLTNCTFSNNSADVRGGGIYNDYASPTLTTCTFEGNSADSGGGMWNSTSRPTLTNCILWGDTPEEIFNYDTFSMAVVTYSDIQGGCEAIPGNDCGEGNIDANPRFVDSDNGDFHLLPDSPCIDAGNNNVLNLPSHDFEGDDRILDGNGDGEAIVDMGVDEAFWYPPVYLPVVLRGY